MNIWACLRISLWGLFLIAPLFGPDPIDDTCRSFLFELTIFSVVAFLAPLLDCTGEIIFAALTAKKDNLWKRPSLGVNPFKGRKPLQFLWTVNIAIAFAGIGSAVACLWHGDQLLTDSVAFIIVPFFGFLGIKTSLKLFHSRFEPNITSGSVITEQLST
ncbi:MAG: hypothetical protein SWQ30_11075 [Thermodesulfobacteriota bacterium]|nr:hypothetical protein [Thermodesulfobacteriota bacterium]